MCLEHWHLRLLRSYKGWLGHCWCNWKIWGNSEPIGRWNGYNVKTIFINVYALWSLDEKKRLWENILQVKTSKEGIWILLGYFNSVRNPGERMNSVFPPTQLLPSTTSSGRQVYLNTIYGVENALTCGVIALNLANSTGSSIALILYLSSRMSASLPSCVSSQIIPLLSSSLIIWTLALSRSDSSTHGSFEKELILLWWRLGSHIIWSEPRMKSW